jgi:hypothetical protein
VQVTQLKLVLNIALDWPLRAPIFGNVRRYVKTWVPARLKNTDDSIFAFIPRAVVRKKPGYMTVVDPWIDWNSGTRGHRFKGSLQNCAHRYDTA